MSENKQKKESGYMWKYFKKYLKKYWGWALLAPVFMLGEVSMDLLQPRLMSKIVDEGVLGLSNNGVGNLDIVIKQGVIMMICVLFGAFCGVMSGVFANLAGLNFGNDVRKDAFRNIMSFSFEQTDKFSTGSLITRVTNDITQLQNMIKMGLRGFFRTFLLFAGGIFCMVSMDLSYGVVVACSFPVILALVIFFICKANSMFGQLQKNLDNVNNVMEENVSGARVVKAYVREGYEEKRFSKANKKLVDKQLEVLLLFAGMTPVMNIILNITVVVIIKVGAIQVQAGAVTPGSVMAAITYTTQILNAVMRMTMIFQTVSRGIASGKRIFEVINCEPSIRDGMNDTKIKRAGGKVEFKNVSFAYPGEGNKTILNNINLVINPGETVGILGVTGCGKSSLIGLIPRFYDVCEGQVLVDDVDVRDYKLSVLRDKIAIALQNSEIFSSTIGENISWGKPDASNEEMKEAARVAQALDFIEKKGGLEESVAQGGTSFSGGQKQRVAISRAIIKDSEILIFDDSTSALDLSTEASLYSELKKNYRDTTKIIVAQRIASVRDADRIIVIDSGTIAACGSHQELMKSSEIYREIYSSQLGKAGDDNDR